MRLQIRQLAVFILFSSCYSTPEDKSACVTSNVNIPWEYEDSASMNLVTWDYIDSSNVSTTILLQPTGLDASVQGGYNIQHNTNGDVTITNATVANTGTYRITVIYTSVTPTFTDDVLVTVYDPPTDFNFTESASGTQTTFTCTAGSLGEPAAELYIQVNGADMKTSVSATVSQTDTVKCILSGSSVHCLSGVFNTETMRSLCVQCPTTGAPTTDDDNGLSTGAIVGIVIGSVVIIIVVVILAIMGNLPAPPEALIRYCVIIMDDIPTWLLGASIGAFWVVTEVLPGGPADGKLEVGYKIYEINDKAVTEENHNKIEEMINDKEILTLRVSKVGIPDTSYVQLKCKKGELLGFEVEHLPMVTEVSDGSKADGKLEKGDRILSINGKSTTGKSIGDINKQLKIPPKVLDLSLKRGEDKKHVTLDFKGKASSGIAIKKETEDIVVSTIEPESAAAISGEIQEKDIILSVNGVSTTGMKDADIIEMLKFSIILKVTKDVTLKELDPDHNGSFGVETFPTNSTRGPANMVDTVTHDGPAQRHGIKHGDTIVSINGKNTKGKSHQEIEAMLKTFGTSISLEIKKEP